jgi:pyrroloquinoline quinone biosynthesis protein E
MGGLGSVFLGVAPDGTAMPCHAARMLPGLELPSVRTADIRRIWYDSPAFNRFRGEAWMKEPCRSCPERVKDFGGCRCQAYLLTGDATNTDPVCDLSPHHHLIAEAVAHATARAQAPVEHGLMFRDHRTSIAVVPGEPPQYTPSSNCGMVDSVLESPGAVSVDPFVTQDARSKS